MCGSWPSGGGRQWMRGRRGPGRKRGIEYHNKYVSQISVQGKDTMNIYIASSWRNDRQPEVVDVLRGEGHEVYDFRHPAPGDDGFHWSEIDREWQRWTAEQYRAGLGHPLAQRGFACDMRAMEGCDAVVAVQPFGRSASLELGWACGAGKLTVLLLAEGQEPELMVKMCDYICLSLPEVVAVLHGEQAYVDRYGRQVELGL